MIPGSDGQNEYGKPPSFMKAIPTPKHQLRAPQLGAVWVSSSEILVELSFAADLHKVYGAPETAWLHISFPDADRIDLALSVFNKTATRLPEAAFFTFNPVGSGHATWHHSKLGEWSSPLDVADGASHGLHYVDERGVRFQLPSGRIGQISSMDVGLLRWDRPLPFPTPVYRDVLGCGLTVNSAMRYVRCSGRLS